MFKNIELHISSKGSIYGVRGQIHGAKLAMAEAVSEVCGITDGDMGEK